MKTFNNIIFAIELIVKNIAAYVLGKNIRVIYQEKNSDLKLIEYYEDYWDLILELINLKKLFNVVSVTQFCNKTFKFKNIEFEKFVLSKQTPNTVLIDTAKYLESNYTLRFNKINDIPYIQMFNDTDFIEGRSVFNLGIYLKGYEQPEVVRLTPSNIWAIQNSFDFYNEYIPKNSISHMFTTFGLTNTISSLMNYFFVIQDKINSNFKYTLYSGNKKDEQYQVDLNIHVQCHTYHTVTKENLEIPLHYKHFVGGKLLLNKDESLVETIVFLRKAIDDVVENRNRYNIPNHFEIKEFIITIESYFGYTSNKQQYSFKVDKSKFLINKDPKPSCE